MTDSATPEKECCANCAFGKGRAKHWDIIFVRCLLDSAGKRHDYVCDDWSPKEPEETP